MHNSDPVGVVDQGGGLADTLEHLTRPGAARTRAFDALLADYARFHLSLAVVGGVFLLAVGILGVLAGRRLRSGRRGAGRPRGAPRVVLVGAALACTLVAGALGLVVLANLSTAVDPVPGLRGAVGLVEESPADPTAARLQRSFDEWLRSDRSTPPPAVRRAVDDRLAWQRPKALICTALLLLVVAAGALAWRSILSGPHDARWRHVAATWAVGLVTIPVGLLLMLMVMGNTQASVAPVAMTLFSG